MYLTIWSICASLNAEPNAGIAPNSFASCSSIASALEPKRHRKGQSGPDLVDGMPVGQRMAVGNIERQLVANLPDQANQARDCLFQAEFPLVKDFRHGPHFPFRRALDDGTHEDISMMVSRQCGRDVEVDLPPIPALRNNSSPA